MTVAAAGNLSLTSVDYSATSATRACAKTWLGNTCRRDWLGKPEITCITTCDRDFCNCDSRSPPPDMFRDGRVLSLAPERSTYSDLDMLSCRHMDGVQGSIFSSHIIHLSIVRTLKIWHFHNNLCIMRPPP